MHLQPKRLRMRKGSAARSRNPGACVPTTPSFAVAGVEPFRERDRLAQFGLDILRGAVDEFERMTCLAEDGCPEMLANKRAGTNLAIARALGCRPQR